MINQTHFGQKFSRTRNMEFPDAAYFHRDASGGDLKAIIYLSDVGNDNGPFTFSIGSHKMSISKIDDWICETNDSPSFHQPKKFKIKIFKLTKNFKAKGFGNDLTINRFYKRYFKFCLENNIKKRINCFI